MKSGDKKRGGSTFSKLSKFKTQFIDNQCFNFLLTVILDNSD